MGGGLKPPYSPLPQHVLLNTSTTYTLIIILLCILYNIYSTKVKVVTRQVYTSICRVKSCARPAGNSGPNLTGLWLVRDTDITTAKQNMIKVTRHGGRCIYM